VLSAPSAVAVTVTRHIAAEDCDALFRRLDGEAKIVHCSTVAADKLVKDFLLQYANGTNLTARAMELLQHCFALYLYGMHILRELIQAVQTFTCSTALDGDAEDAPFDTESDPYARKCDAAVSVLQEKFSQLMTRAEHCRGFSEELLSPDTTRRGGGVSDGYLPSDILELMLRVGNECVQDAAANELRGDLQRATELFSVGLGLYESVLYVAGDGLISIERQRLHDQIDLVTNQRVVCENLLNDLQKGRK